MDSIAATKSKKKNKLFPCFRAAATGGSVRSARGEVAPDEHVSPFTAVEQRNGTMLHNVRSLDGGDEGCGHRKKKGAVSALSRALKAVLFGTSLAKKIRKRRAKQKQFLKKENQRNHQPPSSISNTSGFASDLNYRDNFTCSSPTSAPFSNSSFCSSSPSSSEISDISFRFYPTSSNRLLRQINLTKICSGWFLLLVCLLSLTFCGKTLAIMCTLVWIFCSYRHKLGFMSPDEKVSATAMDSVEYKKRIVIEGFLKKSDRPIFTR